MTSRQSKTIGKCVWTLMDVSCDIPYYVYPHLCNRTSSQQVQHLYAIVVVYHYVSLQCITMYHYSVSLCITTVYHYVSLQCITMYHYSVSLCITTVYHYVSLQCITMYHYSVSLCITTVYHYVSLQCITMYHYVYPHLCNRTSSQQVQHLYAIVVVYHYSVRVLHMLMVAVRPLTPVGVANDMLRCKGRSVSRLLIGGLWGVFPLLKSPQC